ncbi:MAG TPA: helix-turn-helix domain-containing protein [Acidimicrobiales bacterium]|nr:helix-turn-helix domain-containing protein [Acidimicrobiales bacterium]
MPAATPPPKERLYEAAYACVGRYGLAKTTMEDVAREAGLSRATVYRYFPQGKDQLVREVVGWEANRFFMRLTSAVAHHVDLADLLEATLLFAHRAVADHEVLQKILETEPERLLPVLTTESGRLVALVKQFLVLAMQRSGLQLRADLDADAAAEYLARMVLSHIGGPGGWDLSDPGEVSRLVRSQLLAGIVPETMRPH